MSNNTAKLREILEDIDARIAHIEDIVADNRDVIIKLVKQSNQVVKFLKTVEDEAAIEFENYYSPTGFNNLSKEKNKSLDMQNLIDSILEKHEKLNELEEELKKHKEDIIPGQVGES